MTEAASNEHPDNELVLTVILTFADEDGKTRYTACVRHWSKDDKDQHEEMGFHADWGLCTDQMEALLARQ